MTKDSPENAERIEPSIMEGLIEESNFILKVQPGDEPDLQEAYRDEENNDYENRRVVHPVDLPDSQAEPVSKPAQASALSPSTTHLYCDEDFCHQQYGKLGEISSVNNSKPAELFALRDFRKHPAKIALASFVKRLGKSEWMQKQRGYLELAALAAAHSCQGRMMCNGISRGLPIDDFGGISLVNCGA